VDQQRFLSERQVEEGKWASEERDPRMMGLERCGREEREMNFVLSKLKSGAKIACF
jgi:hypothetical protein